MKPHLNLITFIILLVSLNICRAQTRHSVTAVIVDSATRQPVELATIAALKLSDSSLISYTLTDKKGAFIIHGLRDDEPARLFISHVGYGALHIRLKFAKAELLNLDTLALAPKVLAEVTVKGEIVPVVIKKDTIEFNAEAFKVKPNAVVQDLLKKLPGVQIDRDGTIMVNGKGISKIKVDGRDFFANDPTIVTRNLDADMVAKVQIYDDRENDPDHLIPDYQVKKIINLKFKKKFSKSTFGKVVAGGGTQSRYNLDGLYNKSIDNLQISFIGNSKNLGSTEFVGTSLSGFGPTDGIRQVTNTGININDNFGKKVKLNLVYNFNNNIFNNQQVRNTAQFLGDTTLTNNSANKIHNSTTIHTVNGTLDWAVDSTTQVKYTPQLAFGSNGSANTGKTTTFNNFTPQLSVSTNNETGNGSNMQYQHTLTYYHAYKKKGESLTFSSDVDISPNKNTGISDDELTSYVAGLNSDTLNRLARNNSSSTSIGLSATYNYPLSKTLTAGITVGNVYSDNGADLFTYDLDPKTGLYNVFLPGQSSNLTRIEWDQSEHPQLVYHKDKLSFTAGFILKTEQVNNEFHTVSSPGLDQHFIYLFPNISVGLGKFNFNYTEDARQPSISQLQPITIVYNQLNSFIGNPNLKPTRVRNFGLNFVDMDMSKDLFLFLHANVIVETNTIVQENTVNALGAQVVTPINKNGRFTTYLGGSISKTLKKDGKLHIRTETIFNGAAGRNFFETNGKEGYQDTFAIPASQRITFEWNDIIDFEPAYSAYPAVTRYEIVHYPAVSYVQQAVSVPLDVQWPKRINWSLNYTHFYNPLVAQGFQRQSNLLSFSVARSFMQKEKGELRLTCYDLLNQSVSAIHYASGNTINDIQNEALRRYFMLSYSYRFNNTK